MKKINSNFSETCSFCNKDKIFRIFVKERIGICYKCNEDILSDVHPSSQAETLKKLSETIIREEKSGKEEKNNKCS